ncbi:hypothetical protein FRB96_001882 [Tulasnella sp. 330]|nr:hypothetical protein FRB96_001882 [Tulasnella sp. 330]
MTSLEAILGDECTFGEHFVTALAYTAVILNQPIARTTVFPNGFVMPPEGSTNIMDTSHVDRPYDLEDKQLRTWWTRYPAKGEGYTGIHETMEHMRTLLHNEQFDGVFAFSQGAALAGILCAMASQIPCRYVSQSLDSLHRINLTALLGISFQLERPYLYSPFLINGKPPQPPFKLAILCTGFTTPDFHVFGSLFREQKIQTNTLHTMGRNDNFFEEYTSISSLVDYCQDPTVRMHDGVWAALVAEGFDILIVAQDSYIGLRETLISLRELCKQEHFDGIIGFSQGAALGSLICAMLERPHLYPEFLVNGRPPQSPIRFGVFMSGIQLGASSVAHVYHGYKIQTPCLLLAAANDPVVYPMLFNIFPMLFESSKTVVHDRGHAVPSGQKWQKLIAEYIKELCRALHAEPTPIDERSGVDNFMAWQARL